MIELKNISKKYYEGKDNQLQVLNDVNLSIKSGEFVAIVGASGSGKSTLMNIIGLLDQPTNGQYFLDGADTSQQSQKNLSLIRGQKIGFVFQTFNLIGRINALKNVELPMLYTGAPPKQRAARAQQLLELVEMSDRAKHFPNELSGGQKQRVAIARAMVNDPSIILADEPTGALDSTTGRMIIDLFLELNRRHNKTVILITHDAEIASRAQRIITLKDGQIVGEERQ
ncbi:MAG: ABC transporter ATP-binding protein [Candidatus Nomurabacteria bacterium]|nr:ABC transporter ATP-binding protein [Candidatus Nomurabacteria bacterium]